MTAAITPTELPAAQRGVYFSAVISVNESSGSGSSNGNNSSGVHSVSVNAVMLTDVSKKPDPNIIITPGTNSVSISGRHVYGFDDTVKYVSATGSDLLETPIDVIGTNNVPPKQNIMSFKPDTATKVFTFLVTVNYTTLNSSAVTSSTFVVTQSVSPYFDEAAEFMSNYYK